MKVIGILDMQLEKGKCYKNEHKSEYNRDTSMPIFITAHFAIAKLWKQPRFSTTDE
jgi:hypothetical protein